MTLRIRAPRATDRPEWERLYQGYADFYRVTQTAAMRATVWSWLMDPAHEVEGRVAVDAEGDLVGLAHFRPFARPLAASTGGFLDDLFVAPEARGHGAAEALNASIRGEGVWIELAHEAGVHSVKRVPVTESQGRIHTSTATVAGRVLVKMPKRA